MKWSSNLRKSLVCTAQVHPMGVAPIVELFETQTGVGSLLPSYLSMLTGLNFCGYVIVFSRLEKQGKLSTNSSSMQADSTCLAFSQSWWSWLLMTSRKSPWCQLIWGWRVPPLFWLSLPSLPVLLGPLFEACCARVDAAHNDVGHPCIITVVVSSLTLRRSCSRVRLGSLCSDCATYIILASGVL